MDTKRFVKIAVSCFLALPITYCAFAKGYNSGPEISGVVTDLYSGKPLPGVYVVWHWSGRKNAGFVDSQSICYRAAIATTDNSGRYVLPSWNVFNLGLPYIYDKKDEVQIVFKPGYSNSFTAPLASSHKDHGPLDFKLPQFRDSEEEYIKVLWQAYGAAVCTYQNLTIDKRQKAQMIDYLSIIRNETIKLQSVKDRHQLLDACSELIKQYKQY